MPKIEIESGGVYANADDVLAREAIAVTSSGDVVYNDYGLSDGAPIFRACRACQNNRPRLPVLTSIVVRRLEDGTLGTLGSGYFALAFPEVQGQTARLQMWRDEVKRVVVSSYPDVLGPTEASLSAARESNWHWIREPTIVAGMR
jgi:hypothetical protein